MARSHELPIDLRGEAIPIVSTATDVLFPGAVLPLTTDFIGTGSVVGSSIVAVFCQMPGAGETYRDRVDALFEIGCLAHVIEGNRGELEHATYVRGLGRIRMQTTTSMTSHRAVVEAVSEQNGSDDVVDALAAVLRELAKDVIRLTPELPEGASALVEAAATGSEVVDMITSNLDLPFEQKVPLLQSSDVKERLCRVIPMLSRELESLDLRRRYKAETLERLESAVEDARRDGSFLAAPARKQLVQRIQLELLAEDIAKGGQPIANSQRAATHIHLGGILSAPARVSGVRAALRRLLEGDRPSRLQLAIRDQLSTIRFEQRRELLHLHHAAIANEIHQSPYSTE